MNTLQQEEWHHVFHSMGIPVHLTLLGIQKNSAQKAVEQVEKVFQAWDHRASRFRLDSELMQVINGAGTWVSVSPELFAVIEKSLVLSKKTEGLFDISVGAYLAAAGYGLPENYVLPKKVPNYKNIECDKENFKIKIASGQVIEPAAIVKATAIDASVRELKESCHDFMINAGGDIFAHGLFHGKKWRVGIQDPRETTKILGTVDISNAALATSGTYVVNKKNEGELWHHEINPRSGKPTTHILSLSVIASSAVQADIVSTIAFLHDADAEKYLRERTEPFLLVTNDLQIISGNGWQAFGN